MARERITHASLFATAAIAVGVLSTTGHAANILTNGGFETQGTAGATSAAGWNFDPEPGIAPTTVTRDTNKPETGSYDLHLVVTGSSTAAGPAANALSSFDTAGPATVTPGTLYTASFDTTGTFGPGAVLNTFIDFYKADGGLISRDVVQGGYATSSVGYNAHSVSDTAPANAAYFDIFFNFVTGAFNGASGDISIDNVTFNSSGVAPEPASLSLLGVGTVAFMRRRRTR